MTINLASLAAVARNLGSLAAIVIAAANVGGLPTGVRAVLLAAGGLLQAVEHYTAASGPTPAPPAPPSA